MRKIVLICLVVILFTACSHTVVTGQQYSPNEKYVFIFNSHGASGKAYADESEKRVHYLVKEKSGDTILFKNEFQIKAGNLDAEVVWVSNDKLKVIFYEKNGDNRKNLKSLSFAKNEAGKFNVE